MCLAVPAKIKSIKNSTATVEISGVTYEASLMLTPEAKIGDYVIIHAGFAIQILDQQEAEETLKLFSDIDKATKEVLGKRK
jgi:hydrogenase expression/formation protein HypC